MKTPGQEAYESLAANAPMIGSTGWLPWDTLPQKMRDYHEKSQADTLVKLGARAQPEVGA